MTDGWFQQIMAGTDRRGDLDATPHICVGNPCLTCLIEQASVEDVVKLFVAVAKGE